MITVTPKFKLLLDEAFIPAALWDQNYRRLASEHSACREVVIRIYRDEQVTWDHHTQVLPTETAYSELNQLLLRALELCSGEAWVEDCSIWIYAGGGREWDAYEIDMAVPLAPDELRDKLQALYQHQTLRSQSLSVDSNVSKNNWGTAANVNQQTAQLYDALGLAEYEAIEGFKRLKI